MSEDKNNEIMYSQIDWSDQSKQFKALGFNTDQVVEASRQLFLPTDILFKRWAEWQGESYAMAQTTFAVGFSFIITCCQFERFLTKYPKKPLKRLFFSAFDNAPLNKESLQLVLNKWPTLNRYITPLLAQYPLALTGCHRLHVNNVSLDLWFGEVHDSLANIYLYQEGLFDCWYFDQRVLETDPPMSDKSIFQLVASSAKKGATITAVNATDSLENALLDVGFTLNKYQGYTQQSKILVGSLTHKAPLPEYGQHYRPCKIGNSKEVAIIGGGISSACLSLALIKRGYRVTLYCKDAKLGCGASGNQQGALYPLLNRQHDALSELFANSFLYARNYVEQINQTHPFGFDLSGLLQLYYDKSAAKKLDKILEAGLPQTLVEKLSSKQTDFLAKIDIGQEALHYPLAGWLSPTQMVDAIFKKAKQAGNLTIKLNHHLQSFEEKESGWVCAFEQQTITHQLLILTTAMHTLNFKQCEALPLSAARGQVTHINSTEDLQYLALTICHEGYLTPKNRGHHCMGATFKRHNMDDAFSQQEQIENKNKLDKCIPDKVWIEEIDIEHNSANVGIRCTTRDHFPYMGALPDYQQTKMLYKDAHKKSPSFNAPFYNNLFILTGLGSRGLNTAPMLAETVASQINHEPLPTSIPILNAMQCNRQWINYLQKGKTLKF